MFAATRAPVLTAVILLVAGCATKPAAILPPPVVATLPPPRPAMPAGGAPGMAIPVVLADGSYPTPNRGVSGAGATWHLRAALNVAALACRGPQEAVIVAGYNALLAAHKPALRDAELRLSNEYKANGADWRDRYDDAMTRLYNFFSQSFVRDDFCRAASGVLADGVAVAPAGFEAFAVARLPDLERPFVDFYRAYDAWRGTAAPMTYAQRTPMTPTPTPAPVIALAAAQPRMPARFAPAPAAATGGAVPPLAATASTVAPRPIVAPVTAEAAPVAPAATVAPRLVIDVSALPSN